jgi:hypothetical protein
VRHDPEPVPCTSKPHNVSLQDPSNFSLSFISLIFQVNVFKGFPQKNFVDILHVRSEDLGVEGGIILEWFLGK